MDTSLDSPPSPSFAELDPAMKKISFQKPATVKNCLKYVQTLLQSLERHPEESKHRRLRLDNIATKKNVVDIPGAQQILEYVGFKAVVEKDKNGKELHYLEIDKSTVNVKLIDDVLTFLQDKLDGKTVEAKAPPTPGKKVYCVTPGCGFWGDENNESLCSQCHKNKYFGKPPPAVKKALPVECTKGCGFFGADQFKGMCSACFKKSGEKPIVLPKTRKAKWKSARLKLKAVRAFQTSHKRPQQTNKNRCFVCHKKIGTTETPGIECKCNYFFCPVHRMPNDHDCPLDFKSLQRKKLAKENKAVNHKKFDTIEES